MTARTFQRKYRLKGRIVHKQVLVVPTAEIPKTKEAKECFLVTTPYEHGPTSIVMIPVLTGTGISVPRRCGLDRVGDAVTCASLKEAQALFEDTAKEWLIAEEKRTPGRGSAFVNYGPRFRQLARQSGYADYVRYYIKRIVEPAGDSVINAKPMNLYSIYVFPDTIELWRLRNVAYRDNGNGTITVFAVEYNTHTTSVDDAMVEAQKLNPESVDEVTNLVNVMGVPSKLKAMTISRICSMIGLPYHYESPDNQALIRAKALVLRGAPLKEIAQACSHLQGMRDIIALGDTPIVRQMIMEALSC